MYSCNNCDAMFEDDEVNTQYENRGEYWGFPACEAIDCCPWCGSSDIEHSNHICDCCGKLIIGNDYNMVGINSIYCDKCFEEIEEDEENE